MFIMVDLDNTFLLKNTTNLVIRHIFFKDIILFFKIMFIYLFYGSAKMKSHFSPYCNFLNLDALVNKKLLDFLELQHDAEIILATGACEGIAAKVIAKFPIFSTFIASCDTFNCVGINKLQRILEFTKNEPFFYIGDSFQDLPIWQASAKIGVVNPSEKLLQKIKSLNKEYIVFYA